MNHYYGDVYLDNGEVLATAKEFMRNYEIGLLKFMKWATMRRNGELVIDSKLYYDRKREKLLMLFNEDDFLNVWHDYNGHTSEQLFEKVHFRSMHKDNYMKLLVPKIKGCFRRLDGLQFYVWDQAYVEALYHGDYI